MSITKRVNKIYKKYSKKFINKIKNYTLDRLIMSDYARHNVNIIPMTLIAVVIRSIFNFLIIYKFTTNNRIINFIIGVISNVILSLLTPIFYGVIKYQEENVLIFTDIIIHNLWGTDGWTFFYTWKNRILSLIGIISIFLLYFIEINSFIIQEFIFNLLLSGFIVDILNNKIEDLTRNKTSTNDKIDSIDVTRIDLNVKPLQAKYIDLSYNLDENIIKSYKP